MSAGAAEPPAGLRRTLDVTAGAESFNELMLPSWLLSGLRDAGFVKPSPVQTTAIPMGRQAFRLSTGQAQMAAHGCA